MNQNTRTEPGDTAAPGQTGQEHGRDNPLSEHHPASETNTYTAQHRQAEQASLDAGAPQLKASEMRRMNRHALVFGVLVTALLGLIATWLFNTFLHREDKKPQPREETVTVPEAPKPPALPQQPQQQPAAPEVTQANPIPLASQQAPATREYSMRPRPQPMQPQAPSMPPPPRQPSLLERRISAVDMPVANPDPSASLFGANAPSPAPQATDGTASTNSAYQAKPLPATSSARPLAAPDTRLLRGTYIRCVLETHIVTDIPGFTSCLVTEPVYSFTGKHLLLPKGSKVLGKYSMEPNGPRVAVIWDRIVTPTGIDVNMASPGVDNLGGAGHPGDYDEHWGTRITAALLISLLSDAFKAAAAEYGPASTVINNGVTTQTPFESNTARTAQDLANDAIRRAAKRPPTVTIHQGTVVNVYVAKDVDFSGVISRY